MSQPMNTSGNTMVNSIGNSIGGGIGKGLATSTNGTGMIVTNNGPSNNMGNSTPATPTNNCQSIRYCWEADKVKTLIRLRAELSPLFTGKRNASKYAWAVVERELSVPLPISKIIKKWNNLLQEYKAIKMSEEPKRREWPFFNLMDVYFSDQVNDPTLRLFSSTKRFDSDTLDDAQFDDEIMNSTAAVAIAAAAAASAAAANAASQQKIKSELIHGHSGGSMLDISDIIEDHLGSGDSKLDQFKREIVLSQFSNVSDRSNSQSRKEKNNNNNNNHNNNNNNNSNSTVNSNNNNGIVANNSYREKEKQLIESLSQSPGAGHLTNGGVISGNTDSSSLNSSPTSHVSSTNGPKMTNGPSTNANFNALLAAANSTHNGTTLHSNSSSAISSTDRDTDYDDYPNERDSMYDGGSTNLKNLNQKLLHQMNEHHNIDQYLLSWRGFHGNMCKGFHSLQRDGQMVDVTIAAGGKIFKAHKLVLSVCSPYFQKIFLEHPSQHPILFMTDVNAHHMAGLLDFMYSGQVNVKYEDLPNFLKVAEALQVKGLHGESTNDNEERDYQQQQQQHALRLQEQQRLYQQQQQQQQQQSMAQHQQNLAHQRQQLIQAAQQQAQAVAHAQQQQAVQQAQQAAAAAAQQQQLANRNSFKELMKAKHAAAAAVLNEDYLNNNASNNNNNTTNNNANLNNNLSSINNNNLSQFGVHQVNQSKKMLDSQKYQKYYSKRKLVQQYEQEMRAEKRKLGIEDVIQAAAAAKALNLRLNNGGMASPVAPGTPVPNPPETPTNGSTSGTDEEPPPLIQNIKSEPNYDEDEGMEVDQDHHSPMNNNNNNNNNSVNNNNNNNNHAEDYYSQRESVIGKSTKHSILEPNIVLKQSEECLNTSSQTGSLNLCKNVS
ncbi:probable serine/threonine-protein kinase cdc7 [Topomyia yanbarensis]|uniref:probable serine/threonine-protein kinase cdc7 n=1 Tax=Topomyia yanbarensis TaxID=2498891 RepID=UPI00273A7A52|nr:probable serine/threonine-protein kinase cdc7 [Topomyia yanbarensis]XP_058813833.1 probable serine/threonine-protein kinase cdc7 [Topomyia yanbarensis]XP_058813835.1 probable serine/threonine-protein kinase cdc7 [Topomyia yanbarensis]XP_058813836.1 probable serine/threonine-protein kinase cdc7 [Topomyia yanbarensis]XP_058813837.1 probable serine/threonine-protein kinase cdc7 [Topomyia yanbarensis]XP_058813838.1 probable serine/threonine-protein kinase cdc7 [Topomyia yanbarensis]